MDLRMARFAATPSLVAPEMRDWFESCLTQMAAYPRAAELMGERAQADDGFWLAADDWRAAYRPYVVANGILHIPVKGVLLHDLSFALGNFATGYVYITRAFQRGIEDPDVRGIALICDSPGGHVAGNFDVVDQIFAARGTKPIQAFAHEGAYSAAYAIASAADKITVSRTGGVGSIGVVTMHRDISGAMEKSGQRVTFIMAGRQKVDGNPYEALPDDVRERIQARIDELYAVFTQTVARNRGMDEQAVRDTEAGCFTATEAKNNGLADAIGSLNDAVAAFAAVFVTDDEKEDEMPENQEAPAGGASITRADAAEIAKLCTEGGVPMMTASLLAEGVSVADAKVRIDAAGQIKDLVTLARRANPDIPEATADTFLAEGKTVEQARAALFDKLVAKQEANEVRPNVPVPLGQSSPEAAQSSMQKELARSGLVKKGA